MITWTMLDSTYSDIDLFQTLPGLNRAKRSPNGKIDVREILNYCQV